MIDNHFRQILPKYTSSFVKLFKLLKLSANQVTLIGFFVSCLSFYFIILDQFYLALGVWWLSRLFDGLDGIYARETNQQSAFGGYLDIVLDMCAYSLFILALLLRFPQFSIECSLILFFYVLCITSALAFGNLEASLDISEHDNRSLRLGAGLAEGGETGIAYSVFLLFPKYLELSLKIWILILLITVIFRSALAFIIYQKSLKN